MTRLRVDQLPMKVRTQVEDAQKVGKRSSPKRSRAGVGVGVPCAGHCHCGQSFDRYTRWEHHVIAEHSGNGIWSIDLGPPTNQKENP